MSENCLKRLRAFRVGVRRVMGVIQSGKPFVSSSDTSGKMKRTFSDEWADLDLLIEAFDRCYVKKGVYMPYENAVAVAIERALDGFGGKGKLSSVAGMHHYLRYIRDGKTSGGYRREAELLFFLERLCRIVNNKVNTQRLAIRKRKSGE